MEIKEREKFKITEKELIDAGWDYGSTEPLQINDEIYKFIEDYPSRDCDGECHNIVVQRLSDNKYFEYGWYYSYSQNYYYDDDDWCEVFRKEVVKVTWE